MQAMSATPPSGWVTKLRVDRTGVLGWFGDPGRVLPARRRPRYTEFDVSAADLRYERHHAGQRHRRGVRIVVQEGLSADLARALHDGTVTALPWTVRQVATSTLAFRTVTAAGAPSDQR